MKIEVVELMEGVSLKLVEPSNPEVMREYLRELGCAACVMDRKHSDYGPNNINEMGETGILNRIREKVTRIQHIQSTGLRPQTGETVNDSYVDILNYAAIALMLREGVWPQ